MAIGKLSLRQKMINMMYLVLLAILALNVSAEVLKAFYMMEVSMRRTGENIDAKNNLVLKSFAALMSTQPERTKEWNAKAQDGKKITDEFVSYIETLKKDVEELAGGRVKDDSGAETELKNSDNTEKHANYFLNKGKAEELKQKINATRDKLLALVPADQRKNIKTDLFTLDEGNVKWENASFEGVPAAAVMATLTKLQNDCKNTYGDVLNVLYSQTNSPNIVVDKLVARIIPKSSNIMAGDKFEANIFLSAVDSKHPAEIVLNGESYKTDDGSFKFSQLATGHGEHSVKGVIKVQEKDGLKEYPFETNYNVFAGFAAVSADAMNVMYIGVDNPVSISVPGVPPDRIITAINNGSLIKSANGNKYTARVTTPGFAVVNVSVRQDDGTVKSFGSYNFKVKKFPKPLPQIGNMPPSKVKKSTLQLYSMLNAVPPFDVGFTGVRYAITEYRCVIRLKDESRIFTVRGANFTQEMKDWIKKMKKNDIIGFDNIKATTPSGVEQLYDISYTIIE